jgi:hypothetical protein
LNNDGRLDVLSASERDNKIAWYPQSSGGQFDEQRVISETALGANAVVAADLNGDGAPDVLSASKRDDKIARYSNHLTAADSFSSARPLNQPDPDGPQQGENGNANEAYDLLVSDLDADGDPDVVTASALDNKIAWHENLDSSFSSQRLISIQAFGARSIAAADLNSDGLPDVLSASFNDDKVAWYENQLNTARSRPGGASKARCRLAPNPTDGYLRFLGSALQPRQPAQLTVRSARGRVLVRRRLTALHTRLELPPGLYSLTLRQGAKRFHRKVILR